MERRDLKVVGLSVLVGVLLSGGVAYLLWPNNTVTTVTKKETVKIIEERVVVAAPKPAKNPQKKQTAEVADKRNDLVFMENGNVALVVQEPELDDPHTYVVEILDGGIGDGTKSDEQVADTEQEIIEGDVLSSFGRFRVGELNLNNSIEVKDEFKKLLEESGSDTIDTGSGRAKNDLKEGESAYHTYAPGVGRSGYKNGMLATGTAKDISIFSNFNGEPVGPTPNDKKILFDTDGDGRADGSISLSSEFFQSGVDTKLIYRGERYELDSGIGSGTVIRLEPEQ